MIKRLQIFKLIPIFLLFMGLSVNAQVQYNFLDDFGMSLFGINDNGKAIHGNGYYDFNTNVSTPPESGVFGTSSINNDETILGLMDDGGNFVPGLRVGGVWTAFPSSVPLTDEDTLYAISDNGVWVVGQTAWDPATNTSWGFIYNTQTEVFKLLDAPGVYEYSAAYDVNNDGYAVGWVDDLPVGTHRMPALFSPDGTITIISSLDDQGAANGISNNGKIVGEIEGEAFIYSMASGDLTVLPNTAGHFSVNFSDISENGVAVGYAELPGFMREPILYHPSLGAEPILFSDFLDGHGINDDVEGSAYKISRNGKYICGFGDGPAFMAPGFALYLDDVIGDVGESDNCFEEDFSDIVNGNSTETTGSGTVWDGNDNFPTVEKAYQAGGAVKLGTGSLIGFIESKDLDDVSGDITVKIMVKGWTNIEGDLKVSIDGQEEILSYTAKMGDSFEEVVATFTDVAAGANLKIETTAKRAFIDNVEVVCEEGSEPGDDYCIPEGDTFFDWIESFSTSGAIENINNVSGNNGGYGDFYDTHNVTQEQGGDVSFVADFSDGFDTYGFRIWVDWNQDGVFDTTEEVAWASSEYSESHSGTFTVPADAALGSTRMRIVNSYWESDGDEDPCDDSGSVWGEYEDYKFTVVDGGGGPVEPEDCEIDFPYSNANGSGNVVTLLWADDFEVETGTTMHVDRVSIRMFNDIGVATTLAIHEDNGGQPGAAVESFSNVAYDSQVVIDNNFSMDIYDIEFTLPATVDLDAGVYWFVMQVSEGADDGTRYWVITEGTQYGQPGKYSSDGGATWTTNSSSLNYSFTLEGECEEEGGGGSTGEDCDQGDESNPAGVDNGFGITLGDVYDVADDFFVSAGNTLNIQTIKLNLLAMNKIDEVEIVFYENDGAGFPGTLMTQSVSTAVSEDDQIQVGTAFGFSQYEVYIYVDLDFTEGHYWMSPHASEQGGGSVYWEQTDVGTLGQPASVRNTTIGDDWSVNDDSSQSVFTLYCDEVDVPDQPDIPDPPCEFDILITVEPITRVVMADIDNTSSAVIDGSPALEDFTHIVGHVEAGATYDIALEGNTGGNFENYFTVFIKWNEGDSWMDYSAYEIGSIENSTGEDGQQATNTLTIPADTAEGSYTMRVVKAYLSYPDDPCDVYFWGQGEDYTLIIGEGDPIGNECEQGVASFDDLPNAYGITLGSSFRVAEDIIVEEGVTFTMNKITIDTNQQELPDYIEINIREDNAGEPGTIMETLTFDENDYTWEIVGTAFGDPIYHMTFELTTPIVLAEGVYWLDPKMSAPGGDSVWWAATDQDSFGAPTMFSGDDGASWEEDTEGLSMIYTVSGYCETLGTNELTSFDFTYYPNPVKDILYINSSKKVESVQVYNLAGQEVMKQNKQLSTANQIDVTTLPSGVYIFRVVLDSGQIETFKVIKK